MTFTWAEPTSPDLNDSQVFQLAVKFRISGVAVCTGIEWRVPNTPPATDCTIGLWSAAGARLATAVATFDTAGLTKKYFASSVALAAATDYYASVLTPNRYVASANFVWPNTTGILTAQADNGWLQFSDVFPDVQSGNGANFHVSPIVDADTAVGSGLTMVAASTTGIVSAGVAHAPLTSSSGKGYL